MSADAYPSPETIIRAGLALAAASALALLALRRGAHRGN